MSNDFLDYFNALSNEDFEEKPVEIEEFVESDEFLGLPPLSQIQYEIIRAGSQIYKYETLVSLYGETKAATRWEETFNEVILQLGKGCHAPYTPVYNPETGNWNRLDSAREDGLVVSDDGSVHYATESFKEGYGRMVRVRTALGFEEDVYVGHKYLSYTRSRFYHRYRGYQPEYRRVDEISVGDRIAIGVGFDVSQPVDMPLEHAELIGYWLGDGMMPTDSNPTINMDFCADETESISRYEALCIFIGDNPSKTKHPTKNLIFFRHGRNSKAVALAREYGLWGMRSKTKCVPDVVWAGSNKVVSATLSKLWQTDGCVYSKNGLTAEFVSVSRQLSTDVQRMLLRLGVPSYIRFRTPKSNFANPSEAGYVTVTSQECMNAFLNVVELLDHKRAEPLQKLGRVYARMQEGRYYDRVVSIEEIGEGEYWTRTVPDTGNYLGNGMLSANSGKDYTSAISCAYVVYLLLCLKDPARYYGKPKNDPIHIVNIAVNSDQARNVFFKRFAEIIKDCPWFDGKYEQLKSPPSMEFDKNVMVLSGHSEREAFEGLNLIYAVLDEISAFALESNTGNEQANTASATYDTYSNSVTSRFAKFGKLMLLSFPRFKDDFIQTKYNEAIAEKETLQKTHTFKLKEDLPDGTPNNEFTIEWEEDHIIRYETPGVFALRRPTWDVNPTVDIEDFKIAFYKNPGNALGKFACMPSNLEEGFFKNVEAIKSAFSKINGVDEHGIFHPKFQPIEGTKYYMHVDLAQKHDYCAVALAHVDRWVDIEVGSNYKETLPFVVVDAIRWWTPEPGRDVDFKDVVSYIKAVRRKKFDIDLVTFDRWNSNDTMKDLEQNGINTDTLSVDKPHYDDFLSVMYDARLLGPNEQLLKDELSQLRIVIKGKKVTIDHPRSGTKDLSDATCGAIFNAVTWTEKPRNVAAQVMTLEDIRKANRPVEEKESTLPIKAPAGTKIPKELEDYIFAARIV